MWLLAGSLAVRLAFAASLGLGVDESYTVATSRVPHLSTFDHPPLAWWMAYAGAHLGLGESDFAVRLPFVLVSVLTTWLMYELTRRLYGATAGFFAAAALCVSPVLGMTDASWVLPDGPLLAALLATALCLAAALFAAPDQPRRPDWWWLAAGLCGGLSILSKYHGFLVIFGVGVFLLSTPGQRRWMASPWPYLAGIIALAVFTPVLVWNAGHGWISFRFQGGRAGGAHLNIRAFLAVLGEQALFLGPWNFVPLALIFLRALRRGPRNAPEWLLTCMAAGPILLFTLVALWSRQRVLPHWAAPGYLLLFPLLGREIAQRLSQNSQGTRRVLAASIIAWALIVASATSLPWLPFQGLAGRKYPFVEALDWTAAAQALAARGLETPDHFIAATRWMDAGKIDYALHGRMAVTSIGPEPHGYGIMRPPRDFIGKDALIVAPALPEAAAQARFGKAFQSLKALAPILITHNGATAIKLFVYLGTRYNGAAGL
ncbi:MAG: glycosyltransferase family 39 protein [Hyphomicrobiales bacterium]|nr:glycosyltransferase family 39 protein [Hyphomicrobiales bacterium]